MENYNFEHTQALADIVGIFEKLEIAYFLVGSFASGFRGEFRATNDLDIVCDFQSKNSDTIKQFIKLTEEIFYQDPLSILEVC